jgi:hypothetical protein
VAIAVAFCPLTARADRIDHLIRILETPGTSYKVRLLAVAFLGKLKSPRAVPALIRRLSDRSRSVRRLAVLSLGRIGDPSALPALRETGGAHARRAIQAIERRRTEVPPDKRIYVTTGRFANHARLGGQRLGARLRAALLRELASRSEVTTRWPGAPPTADDLARRRMRGYILDGSIVSLDRVSSRERGYRLTCRIRVSVATFPGGSMRAFYKGESSVSVPDTDSQRSEEELVRKVVESAAREATQRILQGYLYRERATGV